MQFPYWLETVTKRLHPEMWTNRRASISNPYFGPDFKYVVLAKKVRKSQEQTPKRAQHTQSRRAALAKKKLNPKP